MSAIQLELYHSWRQFCFTAHGNFSKYPNVNFLFRSCYSFLIGPGVSLFFSSYTLTWKNTVRATRIPVADRFHCWCVPFRLVDYQKNKKQKTKKKNFIIIKKINSCAIMDFLLEALLYYVDATSYVWAVKQKQNNYFLAKQANFSSEMIGV